MSEGNHEKNPNQFGQNRVLNSELSEWESSVMNFDQVFGLYIQNFITDRTSRPAGAGIRTSTFNRCNDAGMRTREVPLVHASCDVIALLRTNSGFMQ